jgi:Sugar (and other) transporter
VAEHPWKLEPLLIKLKQSQFLYVAEIFPTHIRSQGTGFSMMGLYLADIILLVAGPIALDKIGWRFFLVLIIPTALHIAFVFFFLPETKGRSLEDINEQFGEKVAIHYYGATEAERAEMDKAVVQDEEEEIVKKRGSVTGPRGDSDVMEEKNAATHSEEVERARL